MDKKEKSFKEYLKETESTDYPWSAKDIPENPTPLEKIKYKLCQKILSYQQNNNLSDKELAKRMKLSYEETLQILFCWIEKFTLDNLVNYANKLLTSSQLEIIVRETKKTSHARTGLS